MAVSLPLSADQRRDLRQLISIDTRSLQELARELDDLSEPIFDPTIFQKLIRAKIPDSESAGATWRILIYISSFSDSTGISIEDVSNRFLETVISDQHLPDDIKELFPSVFSILKIIVNNLGIKTIAKSLALSWEGSSFYSKSRIITDIRPVFDEDRSRIVTAIIMQTLELNYYSSSNNRHSLSLSLDFEDLEALKIQCDQALKKIEVVRAFAREKISPSVFAVGERSYEPE